jgi:hypothetical protein
LSKPHEPEQVLFDQEIVSCPRMTSTRFSGRTTGSA